MVLCLAYCDGTKSEKTVSDNRTSTTKESILETNVGNEAKLEYVTYSQLCKSPLNVRKKALIEIGGLAPIYR